MAIKSQRVGARTNKSLLRDAQVTQEEIHKRIHSNKLDSERDRKFASHPNLGPHDALYLAYMHPIEVMSNPSFPLWAMDLGWVERWQREERVNASRWIQFFLEALNIKDKTEVARTLFTEILPLAEEYRPLWHETLYGKPVIEYIRERVSTWQPKTTPGLAQSQLSSDAGVLFQWRNKDYLAQAYVRLFLEESEWTIDSLHLWIDQGALILAMKALADAQMASTRDERILYLAKKPFNQDKNSPQRKLVEEVKQEFLYRYLKQIQALWMQEREGNVGSLSPKVGAKASPSDWIDPLDFAEYAMALPPVQARRLCLRTARKILDMLPLDALEDTTLSLVERTLSSQEKEWPHVSQEGQNALKRARDYVYDASSDTRGNRRLFGQLRALAACLEPDPFLGAYMICDDGFSTQVYFPLFLEEWNEAFLYAESKTQAADWEPIQGAENWQTEVFTTLFREQLRQLIEILLARPATTEEQREQGERSLALLAERSSVTDYEFELASWHPWNFIVDEARYDISLLFLRSEAERVAWLEAAFGERGPLRIEEGRIYEASSNTVYGKIEWSLDERGDVVINRALLVNYNKGFVEQLVAAADALRLRVGIRSGAFSMPSAEAARLLMPFGFLSGNAYRGPLARLNGCEFARNMGTGIAPSKPRVGGLHDDLHSPALTVERWFELATNHPIEALQAPMAVLALLAEPDRWQRLEARQASQWIQSHWVLLDVASKNIVAARSLARALRQLALLVYPRSSEEIIRAADELVAFAAKPTKEEANRLDRWFNRNTPLGQQGEAVFQSASRFCFVLSLGRSESREILDRTPGRMGQVAFDNAPAQGDNAVALHDRAVIEERVAQWRDILSFFPHGEVGRATPTQRQPRSILPPGSSGRASRARRPGRS